MAFQWKGHKDIWKGEGIYHLTFVVSGRRPLLGELVEEYPDVTRPFYKNLTQRVPAVNESGEVAIIKLSAFGKAVSADLSTIEERYKKDISICRKMIMDDHIHLVVWVHRDCGKSILQVAQGIRQGITHIALEMGIWPKPQKAGEEPRKVGIPDGACDASTADSTPYHILEKPYIRTLSGSGQLDAMCEYVVRNPYRKYMKRRHPELFTMHKDTAVQGLHMRSMGNHWLLDWPERQVIQCSREIGDEPLQSLLQTALQRAANGAVTYTAAISRGEQLIARTIREAGYPLVVLLRDGFPAAGSESERLYKPGGTYFDACAAGKLLLMEATEDAYSRPEIAMRTEAALRQKAQEKHQDYMPLPHGSTRWRMIAGNTMLQMIAEGR